jgi:ribonuclease J
VIVLLPNGQLAAQPQVVSRGFVFQPQSEAFFEEIVERISQIVDRNAKEADLERTIRRELEEYLYTETKRRPTVIPVLTSVNFP